MTRSPTAKRLASAPRATTSPAISKPGMSGGLPVGVVDRNADDGERVAKEVDGRFVAADVGSPADWTKVMAVADEAFGGVDVAYLNAGVTTGESNIDALTDDQYRRIMGANVDGVV